MTESQTMLELVDAGLRHADGLSAQLEKPEWKPSRAHVEQARNSIKKLADLVRATAAAQPVAWLRDTDEGEGGVSTDLCDKDEPGAYAVYRASPPPIPAGDAGTENQLGSSERLGPHYDGTTIDNQQLHGTTRRNQPVVTAGETAHTIPADTQAMRSALAGLIEAVRRDSDEDGKCISGYTSARLSDARAALAATGHRAGGEG